MEKSTKLTRRAMLLGVIGAITPLQLKAQESEEGIDKIHNFEFFRSQENTRYDKYVWGEKILYGTESRKKYEELFLKNFEEFAEQAKNSLKLFNTTKLSKHKEEHRLWLDALYCAGACLDSVRRLQKLYD